MITDATTRAGRRALAATLLLILAVLVTAGPLPAQETPAPVPTAAAAAPPADLTIATLEARLREVTDGTLDETTRPQVLALYTEALDHLKRAKESTGRAAEFGREAADTPALLSTIRSELAGSRTPAEPEVPPAATLQDLDRSLAAARAEVESARRQSEDLEKEAGRRDERRSTIAAQLVELRRRLATVDDTLRVPPTGDDAPDVQTARRTALQASRAALAAEIAALEQEEASYDARRELLPARRDRALRRVAELQALAAAWERITNERRQSDAKQAEGEAKAARENVARQHAALQTIAGRNADLAGLRTGPEGLADRIAAVTADHTKATEDLKILRDSFRKLRRKIEASGLSKSTGVLLRQHREALPRASVLRRQLREIDDRADDAEFDLVMRQEERDAAGDIDAAVRAVVESVRAEDQTSNLAEIETVAAELATAQRDLLDALIKDYTTYVNRLADASAATRELLETSRSQLEYVEERILWVRSVMGPLLPAAGQAREGVAWILDGDAWSTALREVGEALRRPGRAWLAATGVLVLVLLRLWCRRDLAVVAALVSSYRTDAFSHSLRALLDTIVVALTWPGVLLFVGSMLMGPPDPSRAPSAIGLALRIAAVYVLLVELARQLVRSRGLAEAHFRWSAVTIGGLRRQLRWFVPASTPLVVLIVALDRQTASGLWNDALGRFAFCVAMLLLAAFLGMVRPSGPVFRDAAARKPAGRRSRLIWYPAAVLPPIALIGLSLAGYYYTALRLAQQLIVTGGLVLALVVVRGLLLRWLYVARRRLAREEARRRRAQPRGESAPGAEGASIDEERVNILAIDVQTQRLFRTVLAIAFLVGFFLVWSDVLPALRVLDRVQIWPTMALTEGAAEPDEPPLTTAASFEPAVAAAPANGPPPAGAPPALAPAGGRPPAPGTGEDPAAAAVAATTVVTLADLGLALVIVIVTIAAVRNLPALVEIVVLQRLPLDAGSRYALTTVIRYLILVVGFLAASGALNVSWAKVQWLVAALMFGLAFGLQEIFANLISGLIILAERPVRVGDAVTVGGVTGTVSRIRARATTITDWDRKELVVPNKAFVTDQVINWTLSDPTLRLVVPVGIAYGSDIDKAEATLLELARSDASVMTEPPPQVVFREFGDSSLSFELRVFIPHIEHLVPTRHRLHRGITRAFREAGIEIAFPQRDLHIRSADGLGGLVQKREQLAAEDIPGLG